MPTLTPDNVADLVKTTQKDLGKMKFTDLASDLQEYVVLPKLLKKERLNFSSGYGIQFNVMTDTDGNAHMTGLFDTDSVNVADTMQTATIPWKFSTTGYAIDVREVSMNRSPARIVELVKVRRHAAMTDFAQMLETQFWGAPANSSDNKFYGIDYWIVYNASEGFTGGAPSGFTDVAGLSPTTYTNWKNYSAQYTNVSKDDLVAKWRKAATKCMFKPPVEAPDYNTGDRYGYYTNYDVIGTLETLLENQNENLGNDLASKDGSTIFRKVPVTYVPALDSNAGDPVYGVNWGVFGFTVMEGEYMRETGPKPAPNQRNVIRTHVDLAANVICKDRRRCFVLDTGN